MPNQNLNAGRNDSTKPHERSLSLATGTTMYNKNHIVQTKAAFHRYYVVSSLVGEIGRIDMIGIIVETYQSEIYPSQNVRCTPPGFGYIYGSTASLGRRACRSMMRSVIYQKFDREISCEVNQAWMRSIIRPIMRPITRSIMRSPVTRPQGSCFFLRDSHPCLSHNRKCHKQSRLSA